MATTTLVAAAFSVRLGVDIKSKDDAFHHATTSIRTGKVYPKKIDIKTLFSYSHDIVPVNPGRYTVKVFGEEHKTYEIDSRWNSLFCTGVSDITQTLASYCGVHTSCQTLICQGQQLNGHLPLAQQGVKPGATILMVEPVQTWYIDDDDLDPQYDYDFTNITDGDRQFKRGGYPYTRPCGWHRVALKVLGRYDDDVWLGEPGIRTRSSSGEWAVSYHGTAAENIRPIAGDGFDIDKCDRERFGPGIYSTPSPVVAANYATQFDFKGKYYKMMLQNRVNLESSKIVSEKENNDKAAYFVTPDDEDIRPYGVCLKQVC